MDGLQPRHTELLGWHRVHLPGEECTLLSWAAGSGGSQALRTRCPPGGTCEGWGAGMFNVWFLACVLRSLGVVPGRLAYTQSRL